MSLFDDVLKDGETLFKDPRILSAEFIPDVLPHRENEQKYLATSIKPLFRKRDGRNLFISGKPGIGKTAAAKYVCRELEKETDSIETVYINCWQENTSYKVITEICVQLGYSFTHNKKTTELTKVLSEMLEDTPVVFIFDEIDKTKDTDFLYHILESVSIKAVFLITNYESWLASLDNRIRSRLTPEKVVFHPYNKTETKGILERRKNHAFYKDVFTNEAFSDIVDKAAMFGDIRTGLFLLKESATQAEEEGRKKVVLEDVENASKKLDEFTIKKSADLDKVAKDIYKVVKKEGEGKIGDLYKTYKEQHSDHSSYKTFQRRMKTLEEAGFVTRERKKGRGGNTTIIKKTFDLNKDKTI